MTDGEHIEWNARRGMGPFWCFIEHRPSTSPPYIQYMDYHTKPADIAYARSVIGKIPILSVESVGPFINPYNAATFCRRWNQLVCVQGSEPPRHLFTELVQHEGKQCRTVELGKRLSRQSVWKATGSTVGRARARCAMRGK